MERKQVNLYLATSLKGPRRRKGAYGYVLEFKTEKGAATLSNVKDLEESTEHQSLLLATVEALKRLNAPCDLTIYTDDGYMETALMEWRHTWQQSGWKNKKGTQVADSEKWQQVNRMAAVHQISVVLKAEHEYHDWLMRETDSVANGRPFSPYG